MNEMKWFIYFLLFIRFQNRFLFLKLKINDFLTKKRWSLFFQHAVLISNKPSANPILPIIVDNQWRKDSFKGNPFPYIKTSTSTSHKAPRT